MEAFYRSRTGSSKAEALRKAQLSLIRGVAAKDAPAIPSVTRRAGDPLRGVTGSEVPITGVSVKAAERIAAAPAFVKDEKAPFAHPFYWAPFILIGNPR